MLGGGFFAEEMCATCWQAYPQLRRVGRPPSPSAAELDAKDEAAHATHQRKDAALLAAEERTSHAVPSDDVPRGLRSAAGALLRQQQRDAAWAPDELCRVCTTRPRATAKELALAPGAYPTIVRDRAKVVTDDALRMSATSAASLAVNAAVAFIRTRPAS